MGTVWWKDYLDQVLKTVPVQGPDSIPYFEPLKEVGPSSSIDPDFLMDEKGEEEANYSRLFDTSPPHGQAVNPLPQDGYNPSMPANATVPLGSTDDLPVPQS